MSTSPSTPAAGPKRRRVKKRLWIPLLTLAALVLLIIVLYVRGTWSGTTAQNPTGPDAGTITQLYRQPDGAVVVRCAIVVDAPPAQVWAVLTDHNKHADFVPYISQLKATMLPDGRMAVEGVSHSSLWGDWPFEAVVTQSEKVAEQTYGITWDERNVGPFSINSGTWTLTSMPGNPKQTLLVYTLHVELKSYPNFIVRNVLMDRVHKVVKAMRDETLRRKG